MSFIDLVSVIVWDYMWGMPLVLAILGTGFYLTLRTGFFQFRGFGVAMRHAWNSILGRGEERSRTGILSSAEAMSMALGTTIRVGNTESVATAIATGGPGRCSGCGSPPWWG